MDKETSQCEAVVPVNYPSYADQAIVKNVPGMQALHEQGWVHTCSGKHEDLGGITIHLCSCGATFYFLREAVSVLVEQYQDLLAQLEIVNG